MKNHGRSCVLAALWVVGVVAITMTFGGMAGAHQGTCQNPQTDRCCCKPAEMTYPPPENCTTACIAPPVTCTGTFSSTYIDGVCNTSTEENAQCTITGPYTGYPVWWTCATVSCTQPNGRPGEKCEWTIGGDLDPVTYWECIGTLCP